MVSCLGACLCKQLRSIIGSPFAATSPDVSASSRRLRSKRMHPRKGEIVNLAPPPKSLASGEREHMTRLPFVLDDEFPKASSCTARSWCFFVASDARTNPCMLNESCLATVDLPLPSFLVAFPLMTLTFFRPFTAVLGYGMDA